MTLTFISERAIPAYIALSSDIGADDKIAGASLVGKLVFMLDSAETFIINSDLTLTEYALPVSVTVSSDIEIGAVEIKDAASDTRATVGANGLHVDVQSAVLPTGAATSIIQTDGTQSSQFVDEAGAVYGVKHISNKPRVVSTPYAVEIAKGNVSGHISVNKFGYNSDVPATLEEVWDGSSLYEYLADDTFATMYISSDSSADQGITYEVTGIDSDYNQSTVTGTTDGLDGRTFVPITSGAADNKWWRIFRARNSSGTVAAGNIYISKDNTDVGGNGIPDTLTDCQAKIIIGKEQTVMALWTCPTGKTAYMTGYYASTSSNKVTSVEIFIRKFGGVFNLKHIIDINQGGLTHSFDFPMVIDAKSDIKVMASAAAGGGGVATGFDLWYE